MQMRLRRIGQISFIAMACAASAMPAQAQDTAPASGDAQPGDIIVTAQKREQALIDVPLSITAITGETLARRGASAVEDVQYSVPGISITQFAPGQQRVQIRGISTLNGLPTVGVYLDETPLNLELNQSGQDVRLLDIKRVEVLRGPQGTLYGQGAVGGTIRYITNDVNLREVEGSAGGEVAAIAGGGTDWKSEGMVNVPLVTERLGLRVAGSYQNFGGWIDNPVIDDRRINSGHALTLRGKLTAQVSDPFKVTLMVQHQNLKLGAQNLSDENQQVFDAIPTPQTSKVTLINGLGTYDFGPVTLLSSTSFLDRRDLLTSDLTATLAPLLPLLGISAPVQSISLPNRTSNRIFAQEVRLSSNSDGPLNWTVGGFYRNSRTHLAFESVVNPDVLPAGFQLLASDGTNPSNSKSWAIFGEASYRLTSTLTALVGLRQFEDHRRQDVVSNSFGAPAVDHARATYKATSPRFNLAWQPTDNVNLYGNVGRGFRSGGFNVTSLAGGAFVPSRYSPDSLWSYELGGKFQSADRRIVLELAGYRNVWNDVQSTSNVPGFPTSFTSNSGKVTGWGADGSVSYTPVSGLTFSVTGSWNNMEYRSNTADHLVGDRVDYVPRFTGSASAEYNFDVGSMPSFARVDFQHADKFQVFLRNFQTAPVRSDEQNILNARIGTSTKVWNASVFVKNILNRDSVLYPAYASLIYPARLEPRTVGIAFNVAY
ncbi:TonB-dependent receptor [Sphingomonas zeae]|jgi:outer membrane receptor protein involved in Fe transport